MKKSTPTITPKFYRQGDVALMLVDTLPATAKRQKPGNPILAYGENTGHHHQIQSSGACLLEDEESHETYLDLPELADLTHQEHATIPLPAGTYKLIHQREYHPLEIRRVQD